MSAKHEILVKLYNWKVLLFKLLRAPRSESLARRQMCLCHYPSIVLHPEHLVSDFPSWDYGPKSELCFISESQEKVEDLCFSVKYTSVPFHYPMSQNWGSWGRRSMSFRLAGLHVRSAAQNHKESRGVARWKNVYLTWVSPWVESPFGEGDAVRKRKFRVLLIVECMVFEYMQNLHQRSKV